MAGLMAASEAPTYLCIQMQYIRSILFIKPHIKWTSATPTKLMDSTLPV